MMSVTQILSRSYTITLRLLAGPAAEGGLKPGILKRGAHLGELGS
jgi:hypothetical protein